MSNENFVDHPQDEQNSPTDEDIDTNSLSSSIDLYSCMTLEHERDGDVLAVSYSPNNKYVAIGGIDKTLTILDASNFNVLYKREIDGVKWAVAYSPDGKCIATGGQDKMIRILDSFTLDVLYEHKHDDWIRALAYSPDSKIIALLGWSRKVLFLDSTKLEVLRELTLKTRLSAVTYSPDGGCIAIGAFDGTITILDASTFEVMAESKNAKVVHFISYTPDGKYIAVGGGSSGDSSFVLISEHNLAVKGIPFISKCNIRGISFQNESSMSPPNDLYPAVLAVGKKCLSVNLQRDPGFNLEMVLCISSSHEEQNKSPKNQTVIAMT